MTKDFVSTHHQAAVEYAERGWLVFPVQGIRKDGSCSCGRPNCPNPGKHPGTSKGLHEATTSREKIDLWWTRWPLANIGIRTGRESGLVVLDIDPGHGGEESLSELETEFGPIPETVEVITGSGGRHLYFKYPQNVERIKSMAGIRPGIDIRGDGGYVVAPPSRHKSGRTYEWEALHHPDDVPIALCPDWLLKLFVRPGKIIPLVKAPIIAEGRRNSHLTSLAGSMRRRGMSFEAILAALIEENRRVCSPPLPPAEVESIARSISRYDPDKDYALTDLGNAEFFADLTGPFVRYCAPWKKWLIWDGIRFKLDDSGEIVAKAKMAVRALYEIAASVEDKKKRNELINHAKKSESWAKITAMLALAQSELPVLPEQLDANPWFLNVKNGTIDLKTGNLLPHLPENLMTKLAPVEYDPHAKCPLWLDFLSQIMDGNSELINFLQKAVGYSLTGLANEQILIILYGRGANGKTTFLETLAALLGDYARQMPIQALISRRIDAIPNDLATLKGARFVTASEPDGEGRLSESTVKALTGGDRISARFMRGEWFDFKPSHTLWLACNHKPSINGTDYGIWRRIRLVPFTVTIPPEHQDKNLPEKLKGELPGILNWAIEGCLKWQQDGLNIPVEIEAATQDYRNECDPVGVFIEECCRLNSLLKIRSSELYEAYKAWAFEANEPIIDVKTFKTRLQERGFEAKKGKTGIFWLGIGLGEVKGEGKLQGLRV